MPALEGFSDNPFESHDDLIKATVAILQALERYKSVGKSRIKIATATGAGFSETAAQLEGFARPLWAVAELIHLQTQEPTTLPDLRGLDLGSWITGLKNGVDPASPEYWGDVRDSDQRMVEMESIAYALLVSPSQFSFSEDEATRSKLINWLRQINHRRMPLNNWRWFRVFVNLALVKTLGVPLEHVRRNIEEDLEALDSFYQEDGWSSDGPWGEERRQADYYSGSFAIQFAQLLYIRFASDVDPARADNYRSQARSFASSFFRYFNSDGAAIPFGRSLTYRFAFAAFWPAVICAGIDLAPPLNELGVVKGILLRHMRWWAKHPDIFNTDGTLNIGYSYPNMYMSEDYNSPQSVYWCLKTLTAIAIPQHHPFWASKELPHPLYDATRLPDLPRCAIVQSPRHVLCNSQEHHFLLSSGQFTSKPHKAREAKYGKFAYSSTFGFSVPTGSTLEQIAPDSVLCLSRDGGETWRTRWDPFDVRFSSFQLDSEAIPVLHSSWKPWKDLTLVVNTTLVPPTQSWPGWHLRLHEFRFDAADRDRLMELHRVDSGFAISEKLPGDGSLFETPCITTKKVERGEAPGWWPDQDGTCLGVTDAGASGVLDVTKLFADNALETGPVYSTKSMFIKADSNTNIMACRTVIPCSYTVLNVTYPNIIDEHTEANSSKASMWLATGVFAVTPSPTRTPEELWKMWKALPDQIVLVREKLREVAEYK
ncbi:hypothetical protein F4859DRAFT_44563 [Xylaria cf. heliscus]|nr:hypothetical protein F4859DRAFT_44563 [Xylaria cf. heliscus]